MSQRGMESPEVAALERGRAAYARHAWREAYEQLRAADQETPLSPDDLPGICLRRTG